jgi:hypothetical protein
MLDEVVLLHYIVVDFACTEYTTTIRWRAEGETMTKAQYAQNEKQAQQKK